MITRIVKMIFKPELTSVFEQMFHERKDLIAGFEGCLGVELLKETQSGDEQAVYFTRSIWIDEESLERYRKSDLFADTWKNTKSKFAGKPEAWSTKIVASKFE
jgi:heme-degrading monooxygenase HmoA